MSEEGEEPRVISTDTVDKELKQLDTTREDLTFAEVWPAQSIYMAVFPKQGSAWGGIVYNWREKSWGVIEFPAEPRSLRLGYDSDGKTRLFAVMNSATQVYTILEGDTDDGSTIASSLLSGAPQLTDEPGFLASIHHVLALTSATRWPITLSIYADGDLSAPIATTTVTSENDESWKRFAIDNIGDPRLQLQLKIEYEGKDPFWIAEMAWTVMPTRKHLGEF